MKKQMQNCKTSVGTAAKQSSKCSLLFRQAPIFAILMLCAVFCQSQITLDSVKHNGIAIGKSFYKDYGFLVNNEKVKKLDTVKCYFLEVVNDTNFKWKSGYVVMKNGYISFGNNTTVNENYLPITSGIVKSHVLNLDKVIVKNNVIQIVLNK